MRFQFGITALGLFLGKSPVTIRHWERKGMITLPRTGNSRSLNLDEVADVATIALSHGRIPRDRYVTINNALADLRALEEAK